MRKNPKWHNVTRLPTPGIPLMVRLLDDTILEAIRPDYVKSYTSDPNYRDVHDNLISNVVAWSIK